MAQYLLYPLVGYTLWTIKTCHFIFDYKSGFLWSIFILFAPVETGRNTLQKVNKIYHFTLTVSPHYLVKLKPRINSTFWSQSSQCVQSNRLFATFAESRPMFVFSYFLVESSFVSLVAKKLSHSHFYKQIRVVFKLNVFNCAN